MKQKDQRKKFVYSAITKFTEKRSTTSSLSSSRLTSGFNLGVRDKSQNQRPSKKIFESQHQFKNILGWVITKFIQWFKSLLKYVNL